MTDWSWDYNPSADYITDGLPPEVVAEVERLAAELAVLGHDSVRVGRPFDREGGLREFDIFGGARISELPARATPRMRLRLQRHLVRLTVLPERERTAVDPHSFLTPPASGLS